MNSRSCSNPKPVFSFAAPTCKTPPTLTLWSPNKNPCRPLNSPPPQAKTPNHQQLTRRRSWKSSTTRSRQVELVVGTRSMTRRGARCLSTSSRISGCLIQMGWQHNLRLRLNRLGSLRIRREEKRVGSRNHHLRKLFSRKICILNSK